MKELRISWVWAALVIALTLSSEARGALSVRELGRVRDSLPLVELPAKAAELVASADAKEQERLAVRVVRVFLVGKHSLAPSLVGAICHEVPEVSPQLVSEAVRLFPELTHSIVKAAVVSAPEQASLICLQAALEDPQKKVEVINALRRGLPDGVPELQSVLQFLVDGRVESISDAVYITKNRIGTSTFNQPANPLDPRDNNPPGTPQLRFPDDPIEIPENLSGTELTNFFDTLLREIITGEENQFDDDVVIERYVQ